MSLRIALLLSLLAFTACAAGPGIQSSVKVSSPLNPAQLLNDANFPGDGTKGEFTAVDLFALPPRIQSWLDANILTLESEEARYRALRRWIFDLADDYDYDPGYTASIAELDSAGRINCFSFSNLYIAAARYADVSADFQLVYTPPSWSVANTTWVLNQHVNVSGRVNRLTTYGAQRREDHLPMETGTHMNPGSQRSVYIRYLLDLNPDVLFDPYRTELLADNQILALYYANKGAEALFDGKLGLAYEYTKHALLADEYSAPAWNNLGVMYGRVDKLEEARQAYLNAILVDPDADSARNNLVSLYLRTGDQANAELMESNLTSRRHRNPYYHFNLGEEQLHNDQPLEAIRHYRDAIRRKKDEQLFYLSLAEAHMQLGNYRDARSSLRKAERYDVDDNHYRMVQLQQNLDQLMVSVAE